MKRWAVLLLFASCAAAQTPPASKAKTQDVRDRRWGVRFTVPAGWAFTRRDGEVSTFRLDAHTAGPGAQMRGVASLDHNPFPQSTFASAMLYFSVQPQVAEGDCAKQAGANAGTQDIGGMDFVHGHQEQGNICVEQRDDVYTAYRKRACYRFDLVLNTFCSASSGATELTADQMNAIEAQMAAMLSTVAFDWEKSGPHPASAPQVQSTPRKPMK